MKIIKISIQNKKETINEIESILKINIQNKGNISDLANLLRRKIIKETMR